MADDHNPDDQRPPQTPGNLNGRKSSKKIGASASIAEEPHDDTGNGNTPENNTVTDSSSPSNRQSMHSDSQANGGSIPAGGVHQPQSYDQTPRFDGNSDLPAGDSIRAQMLSSPRNLHNGQDKDRSNWRQLRSKVDDMDEKLTALYESINHGTGSTHEQEAPAALLSSTRARLSPSNLTNPTGEQNSGHGLQGTFRNNPNQPRSGTGRIDRAESQMTMVVNDMLSRVNVPPLFASRRSITHGLAHREGPGQWEFRSQGDRTLAQLILRNQGHWKDIAQPTASDVNELRERFDDEIRDGLRHGNDTEEIEIVWVPTWLRDLKAFLARYHTNHLGHAPGDVRRDVLGDVRPDRRPRVQPGTHSLHPAPHPATHPAPSSPIQSGTQLEHPPEHPPEHLPEHLPEHPPEHLPEHPPEHLPEHPPGHHRNSQPDAQQAFQQDDQQDTLRQRGVAFELDQQGATEIPSKNPSNADIDGANHKPVKAISKAKASLPKGWVDGKSKPVVPYLDQDPKESLAQILGNPYSHRMSRSQFRAQNHVDETDGGNGGGNETGPSRSPKKIRLGKRKNRTPPKQHESKEGDNEELDTSMSHEKRDGPVFKVPDWGDKDTKQQADPSTNTAGTKRSLSVDDNTLSPLRSSREPPAKRSRRSDVGAGNEKPTHGSHGPVVDDDSTDEGEQEVLLKRKKGKHDKKRKPES